MPRSKMRSCAEPGCGAIQPTTRCVAHTKRRDQHYRATTPTKVAHTHSEQRRRKAFVDGHRATNGDWCQGWGIPAHHSTDLTADHVTDIQHGGHPNGPLQVLCRGCNSRKANTK